jgi:4-alpha-glucanotransferase
MAMIFKRASGILLHPTSLPSPWGVGDLGPSAYAFLDSLEAARQSVWQVLPLTPVAEHGSPYSPHSLFAGNTLLLSPELLVEDGYLGDLPSPEPVADPRSVDYGAALAFKERIVESAFRSSYDRVRNEREYQDFCFQNARWLDDFALWNALRVELGTPWFEWPEELRRRAPSAIGGKRSALRLAVDRTLFSQYLFEGQWSSLAVYAKTKGVGILGDVPFYVLHDSADVWSNPDLFKLDARGMPVFVGGVPPDYFSATGQRWGNPVYDWARMEGTGYVWWKERVARELRLADMLRLDHFRGYVAYWEIPAENETAEGGRWVELPKSFLPAVRQAFPDLPFVAEDLGVITEDVRNAIESLGVPGMEVLQFAFDGTSDNPYLPVNHKKNSLVCTGTHDTNTTRGWFRDEATAEAKAALEKYLGHAVNEATVCDEFIGMAMGSVADTCVIPMQDLLALGSEARMNNPATGTGNWRWRCLLGEFSRELSLKLAEATASSGRC